MFAPKTISSGVGRAEHIGHGLVRVVEHRIAALARGKRAAVVGIVAGQVARHGINHALRALVPPGLSKKTTGFPSCVCFKAGKCLRF